MSTFAYSHPWTQSWLTTEFGLGSWISGLERRLNFLDCHLHNVPRNYATPKILALFTRSRNWEATKKRYFRGSHQRLVNAHQKRFLLPTWIMQPFSPLMYLFTVPAHCRHSIITVHLLSTFNITRAEGRVSKPKGKSRSYSRVIIASEGDQWVPSFGASGFKYIEGRAANLVDQLSFVI